MKRPEPSDSVSPTGPAPEICEAKPLLRRIADGWASVRPEAKAAAGAAVLLTAHFVALAREERAYRAAEAQREEQLEPVTRHWTNHAGGYWWCSHGGCQKKANWKIPTHDCCGRCWPGRECLKIAQRDYDGPGSFAHGFSGTLLNPDECHICGEPGESH
ncbi:hypothetical protein [Streptomyces sp. WAC 04229]|uniref:hypothetical protein n=1 Tax=Streptomyces sp. WAC 04229 TaxID=2203206 RepID=UPI003D736586